MDRIEALGNTLSNITLYDIKSMYTQAKNVVFNVSEMEAKVREATNEDSWGASSTLMQEIAQGTFNFQHFNEIMPCIYSQFMEKEARQWRQIYKALQLLEYLVKHGSERVVDDARSHVSTIKMLRSFHYIDEKGKDQGINVRNRSKELVELLADVEKIRQERKKAKANRAKYVGTGNDGMSFGSGRYGGFGNDSYGGDYGSSASGYDRDYSGGGSSSGFRDTTPKKSDFEEYDAGEFETSPRRTTAPNAATSTSQARSPTTQSKAAGKVPEPAPAPIMNLLDFDDSEPAAAGSATAASTTGGKDKALPALAPLATNENVGGDDDFADFQAAPSSPPAAASIATTTPLATTPASAAAAAKPNLMDLLGSTSPVSSRPVQSVQPQAYSAFNAALAAPSSQVRPSSTPATAPAYAPMPLMSTTTAARSALTSPVATGPASAASSAASTKSKSGGSGSGFDDLWSMSLGLGGSTAAGKSTGAAKSIRDLEKEKAQAGIWGWQQQQQQQQSQTRPPAAMGGFGSFVKPAESSITSGGGGGAPAGADDLLL
ncbi:hypothetical protein BJV74DRAFT_849499 [Russula compacta]|nr:hypothetical protein BJV74DRAFT_849499 [Russula compacta]